MYSSKRENEPGKEASSSSSLWVTKPVRFSLLEVTSCKKFVRENGDIVRTFRAKDLQDNAAAHIARLR